jgi:hypothetical protein
MRQRQPEGIEEAMVCPWSSRRANVSSISELWLNLLGSGAVLAMPELKICGQGSSLRAGPGCGAGTSSRPDAVTVDNATFIEPALRVSIRRAQRVSASNFPWPGRH